MLIEKKVLGTVAYMGGVPAVLEEFCHAWGQLIAFNSEYICKPNETIYYTRVKHSFHSSARNDLVSIMQGDWLLMLDTDHIFEPDILKRMLTTLYKYDIDVLVGIYGSKNEDITPVIYTYNPESKKFNAILDWDKETDLLKIDSAGGGCLLVTRNVYKHLIETMRVSPFGIIPPFSEDHSFFINLSQAGIPVYCNPQIQAKHLTLLPLDIEKRHIPHNLITINRKEL